METNEQLETIIQMLREVDTRLSIVEANLDDLTDGQAELIESVANLSRPGGDYSIIEPE